MLYFMSAQVPADVRVIEAHNVKVNEMVLTGESTEVSKKAFLSREEAAVGGKLTLPVMCYGSTSMVEGRVKGVVVLTGMSTRVGSIASLLNQSNNNHSHKNITPEDKRAEMIKRLNSRVFEDALGDEDEPSEISDDEETPLEKESALVHSSTTTVSDGYFKWITDKIESIRPKRTPLQDELHRLGMIMTTFALTGAALVVAIGIGRGFKDPSHGNNPVWLQSLMLAVSMAVSAIPEGLPLVVVICFALGTGALAKKNTLIRRLPAVETLGSASVICSDKTGTLTSGKMSATQIWTYERIFNVSGDGYNPSHGIIQNSDGDRVILSNTQKDRALQATMMAANICCDAEVRMDEITHRWKPYGSSTEAALCVVSEKFGVVTSDTRDKRPRQISIPFSSRLKMMATVHRFQTDSDDMFLPATAISVEPGSETDFVALGKGAPHAILSRCQFVLRDHHHQHDAPYTEVAYLSNEMRAVILAECDRMSEMGLRVLALCYRRMEGYPDEMMGGLVPDSMTADAQFDAVLKDMVFCGFVGMMDPPRAGVRKAVSRAKQGGIRTVMITGDYLKTAVSIAHMVNILGPAMDVSEAAVDCSVLRPYGDYLPPLEIDAITWRAFVFARARPEDKIQIVKSYQRQNYVVGMTGDGVNDAPALKQANIGIAMGITGSEVAKAASDMILTDDKFSSIVDAVELGRTIYGNLRKFVMYLIGSNWTQVLVILMSIIIGIPTPLEPLQILFINLITDGMPAIALSIEAPEIDVMRERPRKKDEKILSGQIVNGIIGHALALMSFMIFVFFLGLWWNTGRVFLANMTNEDGDLIETCDVLTSTGQWIVVNSDHCLKDGLMEARTMVFLTISLSECLRPLTARSFSLGIFDEIFRNPHMTYAILMSLSCTLFITYVPVVNDIFHLKAPSWFEWLLVLVGVLLTIVADEQLKNQLRDKREKDRKWNKLFAQIQGLNMELRNIRSHVSRVEEGLSFDEMTSLQAKV